MNITPRELDAVQRQDFLSFLPGATSAIQPAIGFQPNWHLDAVAHVLQRVNEGLSTRVIINQPPRSLKSIAVSVSFVAWAIGRNPAMRVIVVSYNRDFAAELHRQFRQVVESAWYRSLFPWVRWSKQTDTDFITNEGGGRFATSIGGQLTGRGGDLIIVDDPMNASEMHSEPARRRVNDFFSQSLWSRLNDKSKSAVVVVMQRLHEDDLSGHLLAQGAWEHVNFPAIAISDSRIALTFGRIKLRREGELLHRKHEPREALEQLKVRMGSMNFSAQYQQAPMPIEGNMIKRAGLSFYDGPMEAGPGDEVVESWDIATATGEANDYSACTTWLRRKSHAYLLDVWRGRLAFPALIKRIQAQAKRYAANRILIEDAGPGGPLLQELRVNTPAGMPRPIGRKPLGSKVDRMAVQSARFEDGTVVLPRDAPWLDIYLSEILGFPYARHDDQVDSTSQFLEWRAAFGAPMTFTSPGVIIIPRYDPFAPPIGW